MSSQDLGDPSICDKQLTSLSVRELNRHLKSSRYSKNQVQHMKQRRRTLKNRKYAANCRNKRFERKGELDQRKKEELREIEVINTDIRKFKELINQVHGKITECFTFARRHDIDLQLLSNAGQMDGQQGLKAI